MLTETGRRVCLPPGSERDGASAAVLLPAPRRRWPTSAWRRHPISRSGSSWRESAVPPVWEPSPSLTRCWILLTTIHRSLITDPMAIMGDMRREERDEFIRRGFAADVTLGVMAACIFAAVGAALLVVGQHTFGVGLLSVAPWIVVLDLQDYWRWIGFMQGTPKKSLMNDLVFNAVQALAFGAVFLAGLHSVFAVVSAWGVGAAVAALYGLRQFSVRPSLRGGVAFLRSRWPTSRWLASERAAGWGGASSI